MSEYWKSNAKKYCEICKVWFADNKISVENHERGLKHKGMVQARLREISRKANETDRANEKLASTLMQMEQAAIMSMNGAARGSGAAGPSIGPSPSGGSLPKVERLSEYEEAKAKVKAEKEKLKQLKRTAKHSTIWRDDEEQQPSDAGYIDANNFAEDSNAWAPPEKRQPNIIPPSYEIPNPVSYDKAAPSLIHAEVNRYVQSPVAIVSSMGSSSTGRYVPGIEQPAEYEESKYMPQHETAEQKANPEDTVWKNDYEQPNDMPVSDASEYSAPRGGGLLGPWVAVERKPEVVAPKQEIPNVVIDDLPEEATQVKEVQPTFDELEHAELTFEERKAPIIGTKKTKVVEFKKRKTINRNVRAREEF